MTPTIFLVILCLGVASAAIVPDASLDVELKEQKDKDDLKKLTWDEFIVKLNNSKIDQEKGNFKIEISAFFSQLTEELKKIMIEFFYPMLEEDKTQPADDDPEFEDLEESGDWFLVPDQV
ncbi:trophoblast-specific protein alpha-like [Mastomys coucha]|uniref:trophoblast-specific protein alpha-like n=1 Tax=Mastomys coucha TaxID=35658 RepID=UPI00126179D2|nr:trophoblast-specific protein alpha-like [Mastomys coucha]